MLPGVLKGVCLHFADLLQDYSFANIQSQFFIAFVHASRQVAVRIPVVELLRSHDVLQEVEERPAHIIG